VVRPPKKTDPFTTNKVEVFGPPEKTDPFTTNKVEPGLMTKAWRGVSGAVGAILKRLTGDSHEHGDAQEHEVHHLPRHDPCEGRELSLACRCGEEDDSPACRIGSPPPSYVLPTPGDTAIR
jgi:hypothetical protein